MDDEDSLSTKIQVKYLLLSGFFLIMLLLIQNPSLSKEVDFIQPTEYKMADITTGKDKKIPPHVLWLQKQQELHRKKRDKSHKISQLREHQFIEKSQE